MQTAARHSALERKKNVWKIDGADWIVYISILVTWILCYFLSASSVMFCLLPTLNLFVDTQNPPHRAKYTKNFTKINCKRLVSPFYTPECVCSDCVWFKTSLALKYTARSHTRHRYTRFKKIKIIIINANGNERCINLCRC